MPLRHPAKDKGTRIGRHELKYRISIYQYQAIRAAITPFMVYDEYTRIANTRGYYVRSLYYETPSDRIYREKLAGDYARVKYRLRSYSPSVEDEMPVRVEMKVRRGERLAKHQSFISHEQYHHFMRTKVLEHHSDPVLEEFARGVHLMGLQPVVLVDYHREGYESRMPDRVRLTFDHLVRSTQADELFPATPPFFRIHHAHEVVLEIKCREAPPVWIRNLVHTYGLRLVANSKFTQGIEAGRRDRYYPNGVLIVR